MNNKDADLIQLTLDGDQSAFSTLVEKYQKGVHALVWQKIGDFHIAQEITQDAFLRAYQKLSTLKNHKLFSGWLYVIATRLCYEWLRKKRLPILTLESIDNSEVDQMAYKQYLEKEREDDAKDKQRELVKNLLKKLPESERTVMTLHYLGEMKCETISEFLGVSPNTVRSRLSRARNRLKKEEYMIHESLNSFQLPINMTENIMKNIAQLKPTTPPFTKPLFPWAVSAASAILAIMLMGIGVENHLRFQQPYSLDATSESMIEIVDAQLVLDVPTKLITWKQVGGTNVSGINSGTDHEQNTALTAADEKIVTVSIESKQEWKQTNGPSGGNINSLFATTEGILLAGTGFHGVFRSTDLGASWSAANSGLSPTNKSKRLHVKTFSQNGDTIYASVHPSLYASIDSGKTWSLVPTPPQIDTISGIVFVGNRIYISVHPEGRGIGGIWYSDDEKSWMQLNEGLKDLRIRKFAKIGTTLVVGTENGAYRKKATDNSWHPIMQPSSTGIRVDSIAVMDNLLYIGLYNEKDNNSGEIFRSDDEGDSWTLISPKDTGSTIKGLAVSESTLYASSGGSVFRSDDRGDSWIPVNKGIIDKAGSGLVAISPDTVFVNTNHQIPWLHITNSDLSAMTIFDQTGEGSIFRTTNGGNSWTEANTGIMTTSIVDLEVLGDRIYAFTGNRLFYRANGGETWRRIEDIHEPFLYRFSSITAMNGKLYVGAARYDRSNGEYVGGVFQLDEKNNALIEIKTDRDMNAITSMHIVGTTFYVGTTHGQGVFLWNEGWDSWLNLGLVDQGIDIMEITASESNVYARTQHGKIYIMKNHEEPWELNKEANVHRRFAQSIKIDNKNYILSKREGLIRSVDDGNSWTKLNDGIEHEQISTVEIDGTDFYIGTTQNDIYKWNHKDEMWVKLGSLSHPVQSLAVMDGFLYAGTGAGVHRIQIETETVSVDIK